MIAVTRMAPKVKHGLMGQRRRMLLCTWPPHRPRFPLERPQRASPVFHTKGQQREMGSRLTAPQRPLGVDGAPNGCHHRSRSTPATREDPGVIEASPTPASQANSFSGNKHKPSIALGKLAVQCFTLGILCVLGLPA